MVRLMTGDERLRVMVRDERFVLGQRGRMIVTVTTKPPTGDSIGRFVAWLDRATQTANGPLVGVIIPSAERPGFDAEARDAARQMWARFEDSLGAVAVWIRRESFVGALQRSLVTAVLMIRRANIVSSAQQVMPSTSSASPRNSNAPPGLSTSPPLRPPTTLATLASNRRPQSPTAERQAGAAPKRLRGEGGHPGHTEKR